MNVRRLRWELTLHTTSELSAFVPVFHDWIRESALPCLLLDVASYAHVHQGSVQLIGHAVDFGVSAGDSGLVLFANAKRELSGGLCERLRSTLLWLLLAARALTAQERVAVRLSARTLSVHFLDRLAAPATAELWSMVEPELALVHPTFVQARWHPALAPARSLVVTGTFATDPLPELLQTLS